VQIWPPAPVPVLASNDVRSPSVSESCSDCRLGLALLGTRFSRPNSPRPPRIRVVRWQDVIGLGSTMVVGLAALIGIFRFLIPAVARRVEARRKPQELWPTRPIAASYTGPDGNPVPAGEYRCPKDQHELPVDYRSASAQCPACGRRYRVRFPEPQIFGTWR